LDTSKNRDFRSDGGARDLIAAFGAWGLAFRSRFSFSLTGVPFSTPVSRQARALGITSLARQCRGRAPLAIAHKYEEVYLRAYGAVSEARESIGRYFAFYNGKRPHSSLGAKTPDQMYFDNLRIAMAA